MKSLLRAKFVATAALAVGAFGATSAAHAHSDLYFSVGVQGAPVYVEPAPEYVRPRPVYVQPRLVYVQPEAYSAPAEVYVRPAPPAYADSYEEERAWRRAEWRRRHWRHQHDWEYQPRSRYWD